MASRPKTNEFSHGYALLIGVGECAYPRLSLPVTVKDMHALRAVLTDPALCGYPGDDAHIRLLHDAGATRQAILDGLTWLARQTAADSDATAVVFYSGHGWVADDSGKYYLLPHDVEPFDLAGSALPAEDFTAALRQVGVKRLLVFVDSCHAAGMASAKDRPAMKLPSGFTQAALPKGLVEELKQGAGRAVFSSSTGSQQSWVRPDGSLSLYTYHLIEALRGAGNQPGDTTVRVSNLMSHLGKAVPESASALCQAEQTPFFDTATEDFAVALLLGGKGLGGAGFAPAQGAAAVHKPSIDASGKRSVAAGTISDSTIVTGDRNVVQQGKYNIHIGSAQGLVIGDQAQVTQVFGGEPSSRPGQGGTGSHQPPSGDAAKRHWRQQLAELQRRYETLSNRIAALDKDLGRTLDGETKLTLKERRQELVTERDQTAQEMAQIERQLGS
ncbi:MAG: caspase family protein [Anaerolineae bacterium]